MGNKTKERKRGKKRSSKEIGAYNKEADASADCRKAPDALRNRSLHEILQASPGPLSVSQAVNLTSAICRYLKARRVPHGELTPKIIVIEDSQLAIDDMRGGWLEASRVYRAPEALSQTKADPRVDVYALGIMLFEMLSNKTFSPVQADGYAKCIDAKAIINSDSWKYIPDYLKRIILKATSKAPGFRYKAASEMLEAITQAASKPTKKTETLPSLLIKLLLVIAAVLPIALTIMHLNKDQSTLVISPPEYR